MAIHLTDIQSDNPALKGGEALVYAWSMRDNVHTTAARCTQGQVVEVKLQPWADVESKYDGVNRAELSDPTLLLQDPCLGGIRPRCEKTVNHLLRWRNSVSTGGKHLAAICWLPKEPALSPQNRTDYHAYYPDGLTIVRHGCMPAAQSRFEIGGFHRFGDVVVHAGG